MPEDECVYIREDMNVCVITNMLNFQHSKIWDSINGGMAEMAETVGFQFAMFIATLILY